MSYSFSKSLFTLWNVDTEVRTAKLEDDSGSPVFQPFNYHVAFLPNKEIKGLEGHIGTYSDVSGLLQQWWVLAFSETTYESSMLTKIPHIWMLESEPQWTFPVMEQLLAQNVGLLRRGAYDFDDFPVLENTAIFSMPPVLPGICYNTGRLQLEGRGFWLVFRSDQESPIKLQVSLRHQCFVHNT